MPERRHCADPECMAARNAWFLNELLPKLTVRFWVGIGSTVMALSGVFWFAIDSAMTKFQLVMKQEYVTVAQHREDMAELKLSMRELSGSVSHTMTEVLNRLDRNLDEIRGVKRP